MREQQQQKAVFLKGRRMSLPLFTNGLYYGRIMTSGKEIRRTLETTVRDYAKREWRFSKDQHRQTAYLGHYRGVSRKVNGGTGAQSSAS
jgi:hypothetical protein